MSHLETWDLKPAAPKETRGEFQPIATKTPGITIGEHMPHLAGQTDKLAIVRSIHHRCSAHGKAMYWNMTGHAPPQPELAANQPPTRKDWPSLGATVSYLSPVRRGVPSAIRLPYPLVDNGTLQAGEYGGWLGTAHDPIVVRTPGGKPFKGVSRDLGSPVLDMAEGLDRGRFENRRALLSGTEQPLTLSNQARSFDHFRELAMDLLSSSRVRNAFDLDTEPQRSRDAYGDHLCGRSLLLARRLSEAGVPLVSVCCAAGDLNGGSGDHWDTHGNNFQRLKKDLLPAFDRPAAALLDDLAERGQLDETLVVILTEFGRTPKINGGAGRDHYPGVYSVALAGGGIRGGQVYGSSDSVGAHPDRAGCSPNDLQATVFASLGIPLSTHLRDQFGRPMPITDGRPLPLT
jgi:hypothetical protein